MAIHTVIRVGDEDFQLTLYVDEIGNYVAEAARLPQVPHALPELPRIRVVDTVKARALGSLLDSLRELVASSEREPRKRKERVGPGEPSAA
jgi:hypothetical protein